MWEPPELKEEKQSSGWQPPELDEKESSWAPPEFEEELAREKGGLVAPQEKGGILKQIGIGAKQGLYQLGQAAYGALEAFENLPGSSTPNVRGIQGYKGFSPNVSELRKQASSDIASLEAEGERHGGPAIARKLSAGAVSVVPAIAAAPGGLAAGAAAAGLQSFGSTYGEALDGYKNLGLSEEEAKKKAFVPAIGSGLVTGAITMVGGKTGPEALKSLAVNRSWKTVAKNLIKEAGGEATEEGVDQLIQGAIAMISYNPDLSWEDALKQSAEAAALGGILGAGFSAAGKISSSKEPQVDLEEQETTYQEQKNSIPIKSESSEIVTPARPVTETSETLQAQTKWLMDGKREAVLFTDPKTVPQEIPEGLELHEGKEGVYLYNPEKTNPKTITKAEEENRVGDVLGYGIPSKPDEENVAGVVTVRDASGFEKQAVVTDEANKEAVLQRAQEVADEGDTVQIEPANQVVGERLANMPQEQAIKELQTARETQQNVNDSQSRSDVLSSGQSGQLAPQSEVVPQAETISDSGESKEISVNQPEASDNLDYNNGRSQFKISSLPDVDPQITESVTNLAKGWNNSPSINIVNTIDDIPNSQPNKNWARGLPQMEGFYDPKSNEVFLFSKNLKNPERAQEVLLHEVVGHHGLNKVLSNEEYGSVMDKAWDLVQREGVDPELLKRGGYDSFEQFLNEYGFDVKSDYGRRNAMEELLARAAEIDRSLPTANWNWFKEVVAALKQILNQKFPSVFVENDTDKIVNLLKQSKKYVKGDAKTAQQPPSPKIKTVKVKPQTYTESKAPIEGLGKEKKSRAYQKFKERVEDQLMDEVDVEDPTYKPVSLVEDAAKAIDFTEQYFEEAKKIALGLKEPPQGITETAISIAVAEKAIEQGDFKLAAELVASRSLRQTRRGREIVAERGQFGKDSAQTFIKQVINYRMQQHTKFEFSQREGKLRGKLKDPIRKQAYKDMSDIDKRAARIKSADDILQSLMC